MVAQLNGVSCNYTLGTTLGVGEYGKAIKCTRDDDGTPVVVKQVHISCLSSNEQAEAINEVRVMQELDHLNIVKYIECMQQDGFLYIVMEFCCYGELSGLIASRAKAQKPFTEQEIMFWFVQIALGLWHVHSKNILHRDLKTQNIFISKGGIVKLGDFGISRVLDSDTDLAKTAIGTPYYLSPEICQDMPYNRKSDVWALGCILYELATLRRAFTGGSLPALVVKILKGQYPPLPARYSSNLRALVDSLLQQDPRVRPSIDAVLRMDYVKGHLARYAQHVVKLTAGQPTPGITPRGVAAAVEVPSAAGTAHEVKQQAQQAADVAAADVAAAAAVESSEGRPGAPRVHAPKKPGSGGLRVPIPGFLRKKTSQQQQQQPLPSVPPATCQQHEEQVTSLGDRIMSSLSSSSSSNGRRSIKDLLKRNESGNRRERQEQPGELGSADSSTMQTSFGSTAGELTRSSSISNSGVGSSGVVSAESSSFNRFSPLPPPSGKEASSFGAAAAAAGVTVDTCAVWDAGDDSSSGASPSGGDSGPENVRQRKKLIGTGWIEQQELALARLQADLAASPAVRGRAVGQQGTAAAAAAAAATEEGAVIAQQALPAATPSPQAAGRVAAAAAAAAGGGGGGCRGTPAGAYSSSKFAIKKPSSHPSSKGVKKGGAAASPADVVAAARAARLAKRANWQEQQAKAAADEAARRVARAADLAAALRDKAAAVHKAEEEGAAAVAAHRQHMKAVQPRVHKNQLAELGAAFRQRFEAQAAAAGSPSAAAVAAASKGPGWPVGGEEYQLPAAAAVPFGVRLLCESSGGQAILLQCPADTAAGGGAAAAVNAGSKGKLQHSYSAGRKPSAGAGAAAGKGVVLPAGGGVRGGKSARQLSGPSGGPSRNSSTSSSSRSTPAASAAVSRQHSSRTTPERDARPGAPRMKSAGRTGPGQPASRQTPTTVTAPAAGAPAGAPSKPWKAGRHVGGSHSLGPAVEIYAPYGSDAPAADAQQQQRQQQHSINMQDITFAGQLGGNAADSAPEKWLQPVLATGCGGDEAPLVLEVGDGDVGSPPTSPQVVNVLHTIQAALRGQRSSWRRPQQPDGVPAATLSSRRHTAGESAGASGAQGSSSSSSREQRLSDHADPLELPPEAPAAAAALVRGWGGVDCLNGTAAVPVAQKIEALRFSLEQSLGADAFMLAYRYMTAMHQSPDEGEGGEVAQYELLLFELLGPEKVHFVHLIHKLLMLENQAFTKQ